MKKFVIALVIVAFALNVFSLSEYLYIALNDFEVVLEVFAEYGFNFSISQTAFIAIVSAFMALTGVLTGISLFFLFRKKFSYIAIFALGIIDLFFLSPLAGILMIMYAHMERARSAFYGEAPHPNQGPYGYGPGYGQEEASRPKPSRPSPSDYDAPSPNGGDNGLIVGDRVLVPDGRVGVVISLRDGEAIVRFTDGTNDLVASASDLKKR